MTLCDMRPIPPLAPERVPAEGETSSKAWRWFEGDLFGDAGRLRLLRTNSAALQLGRHAGRSCSFDWYFLSPLFANGT